LGTPITLGSVTYTNGAPAGFTLEELSLNAAPRTVYKSDLPLISGGLVAPGRATYRTVVAAGMIVGADANAVQVLRASLISACADRGLEPVAVRWVSDGVERELKGFLDGSVEITSTGSHFLSYSFTLICPDPVAQSTTVSNGVLGTSVSNSGSSEVWPTFSVEFAGTVTSVRVGNSTTGEYLQLDDLPAGVDLEIVTSPGFEAITLDGVSILNCLAVTSRFPSLQPGANDVYVTVLSGGGSAAGTLTWHAGWGE
jgi:hypothetical protein